MAESRNHYARGNHRREYRATRRTRHAAFAMLVLLSISLDLLRAASPLRRDETPMTLRSLAAEYVATAAADTLLHKPP